MYSGAFSFKFDYDHDYGQVRPVKTVSKGKLKAKMLEYFREVEATGEPLIVTDHGCEVLEVRPVKRRSTTEEVLAEYVPPAGRRSWHCQRSLWNRYQPRNGKRCGRTIGSNGD